MPQVFHPAMTPIARVILIGLPLVSVVGGVSLAYGVTGSDWMTSKDVTIEQPVPFSHEHHVGGLGLDCRYCHTSVTESPYAGIPPTKTCMTCHSQIWRNAPMLAPVRESAATQVPIQWTRVHDLPGYVYFDHSIHVAKGVGCVECHGHVEEMPLMRKVASLQMSWCLECHRDPEPRLRPREEVFNMKWEPPPDRAALGRQLAEAYHVRTEQLTNCSVCHR
jgi:hypothetical protein